MAHGRRRLPGAQRALPRGLNHAPVRPLDYTYLKTLTPTAQRFYELLSYKMFAALKHRLRYAALRMGSITSWPRSTVM